MRRGQEQPGTATAGKICCLERTAFLLTAAPLGKADAALTVRAEP